MITIKTVDTKSDWKTFVQFANRMYEGNPSYCPTLDFDERATFTDKNPAMEFCEYECYLAYKDGVCVGRIAAMINHRANEHWNVKKVRFGWCDFIDDPEVSRALLDAAAAWGKSKGMNVLNGPVGFTDFDHQGCLLEGFEEHTPMQVIFNYPYYSTHFEAYGLTKEADWVEFLCTPPSEIPERWARVAKLAEKRNKLHMVTLRNVKDLKKRYPNMEYFDLLSDAYSQLYNYQPLTKRQMRYLSEMYFPLLNFDFVSVVENENNEIVGVGLGMPDITHALQKANGSLFPFGWYHLLKALKAKKIERFDMLLIGVRPDYQDLGVTAMIFVQQIPVYIRYGIQKVETTTILETNHKNIANFLQFEHRQHKRRRAYAKEI